jgi:hypothetical protein
MNLTIKKDMKRIYKRMFIGAVIGVLLFTIPCALFMWKNGSFNKVPMFTPPPGLILMLLGTVGAVIGGLASLFSRKWHQ